KEAKGYTSLSARLPKVDASLYKLFCEKLGTNTSKRLRQLIMLDLKKPARPVLSGINKIKYDKVHNSFDWFVQLDNGKEVEVLNDLSAEFLKNFQQEIQEAIKERNEWIHQSKPGSVDVPGELVGGGEE
ncbi:MAG: hypothetical protein KKB21_01610, partial [Nanoarchaeota archaeon]|nr:hypothetical protein [Nanoarchaeota archaeon]